MYGEAVTVLGEALIETVEWSALQPSINGNGDTTKPGPGDGWTDLGEVTVAKWQDDIRHDHEAVLHRNAAPNRRALLPELLTGYNGVGRERGAPE